MCSFTSGGFVWSLIEPALLPGVILILCMMIFLSGYGKSFLLIFLPSRRIKNAELSELKKTEQALGFAFKSLSIICCFFMLVSSIYFYLNLEERQTLGPNLATLICSIYYLAFFGMIFITLKSKLRREIINYMNEDSEEETKSISLTKKEICLRIIKILFSVALIIGLYILIISISTANLTDVEPLSFIYMRDIPGLVYILIPTFLLLKISGNFKNFFVVLKIIIKNKKVSVSQKALFLNALITLRHLLILEGIMVTLGGFMGILCNLEDRSVLGINFTVACVPMIYALLINLILLPVESKISLLCDSE